MNIYKTENIRNVVLLGHGGSGKTTLTEAMALTTGIITRQGKISDGNTISDFDKEEIKRNFSISTSVVPIEFNGIKINILDTPGYFDFIGEVEEALSVADAAIIVVSGKSGIEAGTIKAWDYCEIFKIPRIIYVTALDDPNANYLGIVESLKEQFGKKIAPFHLPIIENSSLTGYVNAVRMGGRKYKADGSYDECDIPSSVEADLAPVRDMILEAVAEANEELMDKYFEGEEFTLEEINGALKSEVIEGDIVPVQLGSSINNYGVKMILEAIERYFPAPNKSPVPKTGINGIVGDCDDNKPLGAYVFKTIVDPFIGKYSLIKVCSGVLKNDDTLYNAANDETEKINKLYIMRGKDVSEIKELRSGDIGAIGKLTNTKTGDTLSKRKNQ